MTNVVALVGRLSRPAERRVLPSGAELVALEVTVRDGEGPAESVPVSWPDAPAWASTLEADAPVVVVGRVRRRFFRAGGTTQSRTEVVAASVVPAGARRRVARALARAVTTLEEAASGPLPG